MEIEEALYQLKQNIKMHELEGTTSNRNEREKALLDYITNLQEENKNLKQINEEHRKLNGTLRKENERLSKDIKKTQYMLVEAYALCDEYIKKYNLLQGKSDE